MIALVLAVALAPVPIPLPAPTLKALQVMLLKACKHITWQSIWPRRTVVGHYSDYSMSTAPGDALLNPGIQKVTGT